MQEEISQITSITKATNKLIEMEKYIGEENYYHPFKYEINGLMRDFIGSEKKLKSDKWKIIFFCIGFLKTNERYQRLDSSDVVR